MCSPASQLCWTIITSSPVWLLECMIFCLSINAVVLIVMQMCGIIISDGQCMMSTDLKKVNTCNLMDLLPRKKLIDNIDVVSPILKQYRNDNDISKFRYFSGRYRYDTIWPISTRYIVWTIHRCITRLHIHTTDTTYQVYHQHISIINVKTSP